MHIGSELKEGVKEFQEISHYIGVCPKCKGELRILHSHKTHKRFVGCSNYPKCKHGFPLPQRGKITVLDEKCDKCGLNIVQVKQFKRRPWKLCVQCGFVVRKKKEGKTKKS
jgi:DNA topoisomerase-1